MADYPVTNSTDQADSHPRVHNALSATVNLEAQKLIATMDPTGVTAVDSIMDAIYALVQPAGDGVGAIRLVFPEGIFRFTRPSIQRQLSVTMVGQGMTGGTIFKADFPGGYVNISTATYDHTTGKITVTTASPHPFTSGERVTVAEVTDYNQRTLPVNVTGARVVSAQYNGAFVITKTGASTFTYTPVDPPVYESGGIPDGASAGEDCPADAGTGIAGYSMFIFEDCQRPTFEGIFFQGQSAKKPVDLLYVNCIGTIANVFATDYMTLKGCHFGADRWVPGGNWGSENARNGLRAGGFRTGSDLFWIERCRFDSLHAGITMDQNQSIWSILFHCHFERSVYGIRTASHWHIHNPMMNRITGVEITASNQAQVAVYDWNSENNAALYFDIPDFQGGMTITGRGLWLIPGTGTITRTDARMGSIPNCRGNFKMEGQRVDYSQFGGTRLDIEVRGVNGVMYPSDDAIVGGITIMQCQGIRYSDLDIIAGNDPAGIHVVIQAGDMFNHVHLTSASPALPATQVFELQGPIGLQGPQLSTSFPTPGVAKVVATFETGDVVDIVSEPAHEPDDLSGLALWFKADAQVFTDLGSTPATNGQAVEQWNDQSGTAHHLTQTVSGARPTLVTNWKNSLPALNFDGTTDTMVTASQALTGATSVTLFIVMDRDRTATSHTGTPLSICGNGYGGLDICSMIDGYDIMDLRVGTGSAIDHAEISDLGTGAARNGPFIVMATVPGGGHASLYINGVSKGGSTGAASLTLSAMAFNAIGADSAVTSFHKGAIAEVCAYSRLLTLGEQTQVSHYLARRYAITVP